MLAAGGLLVVGLLGLLFWQLLSESKRQLAAAERERVEDDFLTARALLGERAVAVAELARRLANGPGLQDLLAARARGQLEPLSAQVELARAIERAAGQEPGLEIVVYDESRGLLAAWRAQVDPTRPLSPTQAPPQLRRAAEESGTVVYDLEADRRRLVAALEIRRDPAAAVVVVSLPAEAALERCARAAGSGGWTIQGPSGVLISGGSLALNRELPLAEIDEDNALLEDDSVVASFRVPGPGWLLRGRVPTQVAERITGRLGVSLVLAGALLLLVLVIGVWVARQVIAQRSLETQARQDRLLQEVLDAITDVLVVIAPDRTLLRANRVARRRYGKNLVGKRYQDVFGGGPPRELEQALSTGEPALGELSQREEGRVWEAAWFPIFSREGRIQGAVEVSRDVTDNRRLEAQLIQSEKLSTIGEMAAGIAHEINNPIGVVSMFAQLLGEEISGELGQDSGALEKVKTIEEQATHVGEIVQNLLRFSRKSTGAKQAVDVRQAVARAMGVARNRKTMRQLEVVEELDTTPPPLVMGDEAQLAQVVLNLVVNAHHAMQGQGRLGLSVRRYAGDQGTPPAGRAFGEAPQAAARILVGVSDSGSGIASADLEKLFEPFFTTKPAGEGTGLGLSVSLGIVRDHGGCIWVHSEVGKGTEFTLDLPARAEDAP